MPSAYRTDLARDDPLGDAADRTWAGRILGAGWLVGAGVLLLLVGLDRGGSATLELGSLCDGYVALGFEATQL